MREYRLIARDRTTGIMPQSSLLIPKIAITEPVINASPDSVGIGTVVRISITAMATAAAEEPVKRFKDGYVDAGIDVRCHGAQQSDRQKQSSDAESHISFLGETERTEETTGSGRMPKRDPVGR